MTAQAHTIVYLGLGSNMNDPESQLSEAIEGISRLPETSVLRASSLYASRPWGKTDQPDFLNMVLEISTALAPEALLTHLKAIEVEHGRVASVRWGPRPLDIDILLYGEHRIHTGSLVVPHPRMWQREFVLRPLAELRPDISAPNGTPVTLLLDREEIRSQGVWLYNNSGKLVNTPRG